MSPADSLCLFTINLNLASITGDFLRQFLRTFIFDSGRTQFQGRCATVALSALGLWETPKGQAAKSLVTDGSAAWIFVQYFCSVLQRH